MSLVMDIVTDVLIRFHIIAHCSKGMHYFHRVVGLVVINICQWLTLHHRYYKDKRFNVELSRAVFALITYLCNVTYSCINTITATAIYTLVVIAVVLLVKLQFCF